MFSKTWRVHKIFTNKKFQRMVIKDYQLLGIVCIQVGLDVVVLSVWEALDPLYIVFHKHPLEQTADPENDNQVLIPESRYCESSHMWYFAGILYAIKGLLLLFGAFLAFETRKVTVPALNDSKFIGVSLYNVVILCMIGVPVALMMKEEVDACYTLISLFIFFATTLTICLVFVPKIIHRNKPPHPGNMWNKSSETAATHRTMLGTGLIDLDAQDIERLREENENLKTSLRECQRKLCLLEGLSSNGVRTETYSDEPTGTDDVTAIDDNNVDELLRPLSPDASDTHLIVAQNLAHKAEVHLIRFALSAATRLASFQQFHPSTRLSFSTVDRHVVFGRPTFGRPGQRRLTFAVLIHS
ncbi:Gamma-aminobutyric acid type B receptor subunit 2 [Lamellibrachia satsuma]|nr:Gamma-aminobutyric acid type B receptor subunit 2 [Lamellibrachia satsuma]